MARSRGFCFTWNNPTDDFELLLKNLEGEEVRYFCFQKEVGASGTPHIQGYIFFKTLKSQKQIQKLLFEITRCKLHIECANGSPQQNKAYCSKLEGRLSEFIEIGTLPRKGTSGSTIDDILCDVAGGITSGDMTLDDVIDSHPNVYVLYHKGLTALVSRKVKPRDASVTPIVKWWFGSTGTGKSRTAREEYPDAYWKMGGNKWWDQYCGQEVVIIDDYRTAFSTFEYLLNMLDRYPMAVEVKGDTVQLAATTFIITTPKRPELTWSMRTDEALNQLIRRITEITEFLSDGQTICLKNAETTYVMKEHPPVAMTFNPR